MPSSGSGSAVVRFGDVVVNRTQAVADPLAEGLDRAVGLEHLDPESLCLRRWGSASELSFTRRFGPGDVLFGKRRAYQRKAAVAGFEGVCSGDILVFRSSGDGLLPELLPFVVHADAFVRHALQTSAGSLSPRTRWKDLADFQFHLPAPDRQAKLVALLTAIEDAGDAGRRAAEAASAATLAAAGEIGGEGTERPLGACLLRIETGKSLSGSPLAPTTGEPAVLKVSAVGDGEFLPGESKTLLDEGGFVEPASVRAGDLLMTRANTSELVGRVCLVRQDFPNLMLSDKTLRLVLDGEMLRPDYAEIALRLPAVRRQLRVLATGTGGAMKNISQAKLRTLLLRVPPLEVQDRIVEVARAARIGKSGLREQRERLAQLKRAVLNERLSPQE